MLFCMFSFFFFKEKTAYEMRISDWSSDVYSSDLLDENQGFATGVANAMPRAAGDGHVVAGLELNEAVVDRRLAAAGHDHPVFRAVEMELQRQPGAGHHVHELGDEEVGGVDDEPVAPGARTSVGSVRTGSVRLGARGSCFINKNN